MQCGTNILYVTSYHFVCLPHVLVHLLRLGGVVVALGARLVRLPVVAVLQSKETGIRSAVRGRSFYNLRKKEGFHDRQTCKPWLVPRASGKCITWYCNHRQKITSQHLPRRATPCAPSWWCCSGSRAWGTCASASAGAPRARAAPAATTPASRTCKIIRS